MAIQVIITIEIASPTVVMEIEIASLHGPESADGMSF